jgi:ribosome-binding factor A
LDDSDIHARLAARIQERAARWLARETQDPRLAGVTITRVELNDELEHARLHYSVLGSVDERASVERALRSAAPRIQRKLAGELGVRRVPHLSWRYDDSIERQAALDEAIREALELDRRINPRAHAELAEPQPIVDEELVLEAEINDFLDEQAREEGRSSAPKRGEKAP